MGGLTLTVALLFAGLRHESAGEPGCGRRHVTHDGERVFTGTARETWAWLRGEVVL
jgi:hypothetical protein